jgi:hypothetical protein
VVVYSNENAGCEEDLYYESDYECRYSLHDSQPPACVHGCDSQVALFRQTGTIASHAEVTIFTHERMLANTCHDWHSIWAYQVAIHITEFTLLDE